MLEEKWKKEMQGLNRAQLTSWLDFYPYAKNFTERALKREKEDSYLHRQMDRLKQEEKFIQSLIGRRVRGN